MHHYSWFTVILEVHFPLSLFLVHIIFSHLLMISLYVLGFTFLTKNNYVFNNSLALKEIVENQCGHLIKRIDIDNEGGYVK